MSAAEHATIKRERDYNALTTELDVAIRLLNQAADYGAHDDWRSASNCRVAAAAILESIGPEKIIIDPDVIP